MKSLMAAAMAAALLSASVAMTVDANSQSLYGTQTMAIAKGHRTAPSTEPWAEATPAAIRTMPASIEGGVDIRRRAALATLFLIGAAAPCVRAEGKVLIASGGC